MDDWIFLDWSTIEYIWRADGGPGAQAALVEVQGAEGQLWAGTVLTSQAVSLQKPRLPLPVDICVKIMMRESYCGLCSNVGARVLRSCITADAVFCGGSWCCPAAASQLHALSGNCGSWLRKPQVSFSDEFAF